MKIPLSALLLACAPLLAQAAAPVKATVTMRDPSAVEVRYEIPPACTALEFRNHGMPSDLLSQLRSDWHAADDCTALEDGRIVRKKATCTALRLRVPASTRNLDRVYPWAYPIEKGLFVHTSAYAVTDACGAVDWTFEAPGGTVVVDGVMSAERGTHAAGLVADYMPVVLTGEPFRSMEGRRVLADARFTPESLRLMDATVAGSARQLAHDQPDIPFAIPFIVASPASNWRGDVSNRTVMRLALTPTPGPEQEAIVHDFIPHEVGHLLQPLNWSDAWQSDITTISEGGAEFMRVATAAHLGWLDRAALKADLERAVNSCVQAAQGGPWKAMRNRNWDKNPYDCGLTFYAIGLSASGPDRPLLRLRDYNRKAKLGERTDFAQDIECGGTKDCRPRWLPRLAGDEPLDAVLLDYARQPGALLRVADTWSPAQVKVMGFQQVAQLMRADCGGATSFYAEDSGARIAAGPNCGVLRPDMVIANAEGLPLFEDANAVKASIEACHARGKTVLGLRDGSSVTVSCSTSIKLSAHVYAVDEARALALLK